MFCDDCCFLVAAAVAFGATGACSGVDGVELAGDGAADGGLDPAPRVCEGMRSMFVMARAWKLSLLMVGTRRPFALVWGESTDALCELCEDASEMGPTCGLDAVEAGPAAVAVMRLVPLPF